MRAYQLQKQEIEEQRKYYRVIALLYFSLGMGIGALLILLFF